MSVWRFGEPAGLRAAMGVLPPAVLAGPVTAWEDGAARLVEAPAVPAAVDAAVRALGAELVARPTGGVRHASWAELLEPEPEPLPNPVASVLLVGTSAAAARTAAELVRLGCERVHLCAVGDHTLLRVAAPPSYTVLRALEPDADVRAYLPAGGGVWVQAGWAHPLAHRLRAAPAELRLIPARGRATTWPDGPWIPLDEQLDVELAPALPQPADPPRHRVTVPLRLGRRPSPPPSLWICDAPEAVDALLPALPGAVADALRVAVLPADGTRGERLLLRLRPGVDAALPGAPYSACEAVPGLYLPSHTGVEPPLRAARLQALLGPPEGAVGWIEPGEPLRVRWVHADRFVPVDDYVDYPLDRDAEALAAWQAGVRFQFEGLTLAEPAPVPAPPRPPAPRAPKAPAVAAPAPPVPAPPRAAPEPPAPSPDPEPSGAAADVAAAEQRVRALDGPPGDAAYADAWLALARAYTAASRHRDAGLAFSRALWHRDDGEALEAFVDATAHAGPVHALLAEDRPDYVAVRAVAAAVIAGRPPPGPCAAWLDRHDRALDLRTRWLCACALADAAGGDPRRLARTRDTVFAALEDGLPIARELPPFLRLQEPAVAARLSAALEDLRARFFEVRRARDPAEAPIALTRPYVDLIAAWGLARLGDADRARSRCEAARAALPRNDTVHAWCGDALVERVQQALDGAPSDAPLSEPLLERQRTLTAFERYLVDRVRQACTVVEPHPAASPFTRFHTRRAADAEPPVPSPDDPTARAERALRLVASATPDPHGPPAALMEALPLIAGLPDGIVEVPLRAALEAGGALSAGPAFVVGARVLAIAALAGSPIAEPAAALVLRAMTSAEALDLDPVRYLPGVVRSLRRAGRGADADTLLERLLARAPDLNARLPLAGHLLDAGRASEAQEVLDAAWSRLAQRLPLPERLTLARGLAAAEGRRSPEQAIAAANRLLTLIEPVTDRYSTNTHVALSVLEYAEIVTRTVAHDAQLLSPGAQGVADGDELLLRQRVHRDLASRSRPR